MNTLPEEILIQILLQLNYKDIISIYQIIGKFNLQSILKQRANIGFPRTQHEVHKIPDTVINDITIIKGQNVLRSALEYLYDTNADLIFGDLVIIECLWKSDNKKNSGITIFDGLNIMPLSYDIYADGNLPNNFQVIKNNVPIHYWRAHCKYGISNNEFVWFDHSSFRDQCIKNIKYETHKARSIQGEYDIHNIYTEFIFNDIKYYIVLDYTSVFVTTISRKFLFDADITKAIDYFKCILTRSDVYFYGKSVTPTYNHMCSDQTIFLILEDYVRGYDD